MTLGIDDMKKILINNLMAACGSLALMLIMDIIHVHIRPVIHHWILIFPAGIYALVYAANNGILKGKHILLRIPVIALLSAILTWVWFWASMLFMRCYFHGLIGGQ